MMLRSAQPGQLTPGVARIDLPVGAGHTGLGHCGNQLAQRSLEPRDRVADTSYATRTHCTTVVDAGRTLDIAT